MWRIFINKIIKFVWKCKGPSIDNSDKDNTDKDNTDKEQSWGNTVLDSKTLWSYNDIQFVEINRLMEWNPTWIYRDLIFDKSDTAKK